MNAIFDVRTLRIDKNGDLYTDKRRIFRRAVDTKVMRVQRDYMMRAEKLDEKCASSYNTHPFAEALKNHFHSGGVHPLVFGAFGETNKETQRLIKTCVKNAASRMENSDVTPLSNTMQKGTAYQVMLIQFRRAMGVLAIRTTAETKIRRTELIRATRTETNAAAHPEQRKFYENAGNPCFWYKNRDNEEHFHKFYAYHAQYNNFYTDQ